MAFEQTQKDLYREQKKQFFSLEAADKGICQKALLKSIEDRNLALPNLLRI